MTAFMCIDPGATHKKYSDSERGTGWAVISTDGESDPPVLLASGHIVGGPDEFLAAYLRDAQFRGWLANSDVLVVENFKLWNKAASPDPLEIIGMCKMYHANSGKPIHVRMPGTRVSVTHDDLKRIGMWPGGRGHADTAQAIRHGLSFLMSSGHVPTMMLVSPPPLDEEG